MDDSTTNTRSSSQGSGSGTSSNYSWLDDYQSGNYDSLPHDEIFTGYRSWSQTADQDDLYEATYRGYETLGQDQWGSAASDLWNHSQSRGMDLSDLQLSSPDYQSWNAQDMARVTGRVYGGSAQNTEQQDKQESGSGGGIPKPIIGLALAGALAFAASKVMGGKSDKQDDGVEGYDLDTATTTNYNRDTMSTDSMSMESGSTASDYMISGASMNDYTADNMGTGMSSGTSGNDWSAGSSMSDSNSGNDWSGSTSGSTMSGGTAGNEWSSDNAGSMGASGSGSTLSGGFGTSGGTSGTSWSGNTTGGDLADDMSDDASGGGRSGSSYNTTS